MRSDSLSLRKDDGAGGGFRRPSGHRHRMGDAMSRRLGPITLLVLVASLAIAGPVAAQEAFEDPPDDVTEGSGLVADELGAVPATPDPTVVDPRPHPWDRVVVASDGRSLDVYFWMGIEDCNGLHSVEVAPTDGGIELALYTGTPATMEPGTACIEIAQYYVTQVVLEAPLIGNVG